MHEFLDLQVGKTRPMCVCVREPGSQGEPWPDADPWHSQESQLSVVSTQGVDPLD